MNLRTFSFESHIVTHREGFSFRKPKKQGRKVYSTGVEVIGSDIRQDVLEEKSKITQLVCTMTDCTERGRKSELYEKRRIGIVEVCKCQTIHPDISLIH